MSQEVETGAVGTAVTCPCGHREIVSATGTYHITLWPRWVVDAEHSSVSVVDAWRYICDECWEELPDE